MTCDERKSALAAWDAAVAVTKARIRALNDPAVTPQEYAALSAAEDYAGEVAVLALGGWLNASPPLLTAWPDAR